MLKFNANVFNYMIYNVIYLIGWFGVYGPKKLTANITNMFKSIMIMKNRKTKKIID